MPGVKAVLTADDLPKPADSINDNGQVIFANLDGEVALTNEPVYQGQPILAVAAVDEVTAADAIEKIEIDFEPLPFCRRSAGEPASRRSQRPDQRQLLVHSAAGTAATAGTGPRRPAAEPTASRDQRVEVLPRRSWPRPRTANCRIMADAPEKWSYGDLDAGFKNAALVLDETFVTPDTSHQTLETRTVDGVLAERQGARLHRHAEHCPDRDGRRPMGRRPS